MYAKEACALADSRFGVSDLHEGCKQTTKKLQSELFLMMQCSLQLCVCLFCNHTRCFTHRGGGSVDDISLTSLISLFILQQEDHRPMWNIYTVIGEQRY